MNPNSRLQLELSYNWHFNIPDRSNDAEAAKVKSSFELKEKVHQIIIIR